MNDIDEAVRLAAGWQTCRGCADRDSYRLAKALLSLHAEAEAMRAVCEAANGLRPRLNYAHVCPDGCPLCSLINAVDALRATKGKP